MPGLKVLAISGSLRRDSYNRKALQIAKQLAAEAGGEVEEADLKELALPIYDGDIEAQGMPDSVLRLKAAVEAADVLLIVLSGLHGCYLACVATHIVSKTITVSLWDDNAIYIRQFEFDIAQNSPFALHIEVVKVLLRQIIVKALQEAEELPCKEHIMVFSPVIVRGVWPRRTIRKPWRHSRLKPV